MQQIVADLTPSSRGFCLRQPVWFVFEILRKKFTNKYLSA
jgi:hypothetical protein